MGKEFKLLFIELFNIFNYRGTHIIDFRTNRQGNVFLFDIKNGGGKTSLFLAIKWGFYGFDSGIRYDKDGIVLRSTDFMNADERQTSGKFRVKIAFMYDDQYMEIRRECPDYRSNESVLNLKIGEGAYGVMKRDIKEGGRYRREATDMVSRIIPPDYGNFFMFNGEILSDIANNQKESEKVDGVLKLLGLKQLSNLRDIVKKISRNLDNEETKQLASSTNLIKFQEDLKKTMADLERGGDEKKELDEEIGKIDREIQMLNQERESYKDQEAQIIKIKDLKAKEAGLESKKDQMFQTIYNHRANAFLIFIEDDIRSIKEKYSAEERKISKELSSPRGRNNQFASIYEEILQNHLNECPVCRSLLSESKLDDIRGYVKHMAGDTEEYRELRSRQNDLASCIRILSESLDSKPAKLEELCDGLFKTSEELDLVKNNLDELNRVLSKSDIEAVSEISNRIIPLTVKRTKLVADRNRRIKTLKGMESRITTLKNNIMRETALDESQKRLSNRVKYAKSLVSKLDEIIEGMKRKKRQDILEKADNVFMDITNKPEAYSHLAYDDQNSFSMHIVRKDGSTVIHPSSGEKHVIAISFLISLSLNTERLTPMMMDTPLSRLDTHHKENIARTLAKLDNQVLFLAQPGELDDATRRSFLPAVAKMYESRPNADNVACIVEVDP